MSDNWQNDLSASSKDFQAIVWPKIKDWLGGGDLYPVEAVTTTTVAKDLDILAGIDAWHVQRTNGRMRGIASRIQWTRTPFKTFSIRTLRNHGVKTEFEKRLEQMNSSGGWLMPAITVQAYLLEKNFGPLLYCCCVKTIDLFRAIEFFPEILSHEITNIDGSSKFKFVTVEQLKTHGCQVREYASNG